MKIVSNIGPFYEKLVKEFLVNLTLDCNVERSQKYMKVYIRGKCLKFSPSIIDAYLGINKSAEYEKSSLHGQDC